MSELVVAATGHRPHKLGGYDSRNPIRTALRLRTRARLIELGASEGISGMALGFDMDFAEILIELGLPFTAAVPFKGQESMWLTAWQRHYHKLLEKAAEVVYVCDPGYAGWKMQKRNEWMVDHCGHLIAAWDGSEGGTRNCVRYAEKVGREMTRFDPRLQGIVVAA